MIHSARELLITVIAAFIVVTSVLLAGSITAPSGDPEPTFYTLEDVYNLIHDIDIATEGDHTISPESGQSTSATSSYSVSQIYADLANLIKRENVATGTIYLGVTGDFNNPDPAYATTTIISSSLTPFGTPGESQGYSLEDIWNLINDNTTTTDGAHNVNPDSTPSDSMYTTTEIYEALTNLIDPNQIKAGIVYLGVTGTYEIGDGSMGDPYQIPNWTLLNNINNNLSSYYLLTTNLSSNNSDYAGLGDDWQTIGTSTPFSGNFNGNNKTISDLIINLSGQDNVGLFANSTGEIYDLGLLNTTVNGKNLVGGLVGQLSDGGTIVNSYIDGDVSGVNEFIGGLAGHVTGSAAVVSNSYSSGTVMGGDEYATGGLLGSLDSGAEVSNSYSSSEVISQGGSWYTGGLIGGSTNGVITDSYATGNVTGGTEVGGLLGGTYSSVTITNSYATGNVNGVRHVAGLVGLLDDGGMVSLLYATGNVTASGDRSGGLIGFASSYDVIDSYATGDVEGENLVGGLIGYIDNGSVITNSYSTGNVIGSGVDTGGLIGRKDGATVNTSYWNIDTSGQATSAGGTGTTTVAMYKQVTFIGWDFDTIWSINEDSDYPRLQ